MNIIPTLSPARPQTWILPKSLGVRPTTLAELAQGFAPISLQQMDAVALLNRTDTKFVMPEGQLLRALADLQSDYRMLSVNGQWLNHYRTLYFDTPGFDLYHLHVNERAERYKVRSREYTDSSLSFLEVKHKTRKDRTIKQRLSTAQPMVQFTQAAENWLDGVFPFDSRRLEPKIWNTFTRLTLVSKQTCERVTLDVDLTFYNEDEVLQLDGIAIAEVKRDTYEQLSLFVAKMRSLRIHPRGFSKYCFGVSMLHQQVKKNTMKPKRLWIEKLIKGTESDE